MADERKTKQRRKCRRRPLSAAADQATVAGLVLAAARGMGVYWIVQGGLRGDYRDRSGAPARGPVPGRCQRGDLAGVGGGAGDWRDAGPADCGIAAMRRAVCRPRGFAARQWHRAADAGADEAVSVADAGSGRSGRRHGNDRSRVSFYHAGQNIALHRCMESQ